jgi:cyclophilin family peptidyl-prolyl cis-trans isomerase/HEAT repeat protein
VVTREELLHYADARRASPALLEALSSTDPHLRETATLALARLHDPAHSEHLIRALRDPEPAIRDWASLGLGALEEQAPASVTRALVGALASEADPAGRGHLLEDLGRLATEEAIAAFASALASNDPNERRGACRGLGAIGLRGRSVPADLAVRAAHRMVDDPSASVRAACAYALTRLPLAERDVGDALVRALADSDPHVRVMALRALARYPMASDSSEILERLTRDPEHAVAVAAFRALAQFAVDHRAASTYAAALERSLDALLASGDVGSGEPLHTFLTGLDGAARLAREPSIQTTAQRIWQRVGQVSPDRPTTRDRGLVHCAAARLIDLGLGWPSRVDECGLEQIEETERRVLAAEVIARVDGQDAQRGVYLERLLADSTSVVREAALAAMATIPTSEALSAVLRTLTRDEDVGVRIAGLEALRTIHARRAERRTNAVLSSLTLPDDDWPSEAIETALRSLARELSASNHLEALVTWLTAVREIAPDALADQVRPLASHNNASVRMAARAALAAAGAETIEQEPEPLPNLVSVQQLASIPEGRVRLETDRGSIELELFSDRAPTTVLRFVELVRAGFYDGLTFHRVVPAFVIQGGDPRGDGYGDPGWSQRCEDHRTPYERGVVGMALAGRDTGGSQFFIALSSQPHLDGRYTAFGRVVSGMERVTQIQAGDRILHATFIPR